jgi:hypothetical protein
LTQKDASMASFLKCWIYQTKVPISALLKISGGVIKTSSYKELKNRQLETNLKNNRVKIFLI